VQRDRLVWAPLDIWNLQLQAARGQHHASIEVVEPDLYATMTGWDGAPEINAVLSVCIHIYIYIIHTYIYIHMYMHILIHIYTYIIHTHIYIYMYMHI